MFGINRMFKLVAVVAASVMIVACGQDKEKVSAASENNMIPDNAVFALKIDAQQLWEKALGNPPAVHSFLCRGCEGSVPSAHPVSDSR